MSLLVTGSIGIDTVETFGRRDNVIGGKRHLLRLRPHSSRPSASSACRRRCRTPFDIFKGRDVIPAA
jgi:hypothetical protein